MTYLVLARKWRPQLFSEVVGQPHVTRILQNAITAERLAHAYLFSGPRGVGKTSVARILSKAVNCEKGVVPEPCCECKNCVDIAAGKSPDVLEIDGASNRGIDNIRSLQESIAYKPIRSRYKIYIIDEVHMLTNEAFNALLKTLEEPPPHVKFVFATTDPHKLPPTVISRCQRFEFRRIPIDLIVEHLKMICKEEGFDVEPDVISAIAREAEGGLRDAETLLEQVVSFHGEDIDTRELLDLLGIVDRATILETIEAVVDSNYLKCVELAQRIFERGIDCVRFCDRLLEVVQSIFLISLDSSNIQKLSAISSEELDKLKTIASKTSPSTLQLYYEILLKGSEQAKRSSTPHLVLEATLLKLANVPNLVAIPKILKELKTLPESQIQSQKLVSFPEKTSVSKKKRGSDVVGDWSLFLDWLNEKEPLLRSQLEGSRPVKMEADKYQIFVMPIYAEMLNLPEKHERLKEVFQEFFGLSDVALTIKSDSNHTRARNSIRNNEDIRRMVLNHPAVRDVLEIMGGRVIEVRKSRKQPNLEERL